MSFLMELHDLNAQVRGQLLLMDPIPPINKVFALISQEEHQRNIMVVGNDPVTFSVRHGQSRNNQGNVQKKDKPICTHYGFSGHTLEKCYKLHSYPPGYKSKQRNGPNNNMQSTVVGQVFEASSNQPKDNDIGGNFVQFLSPVQYQQLMSMLSSHLSSTKVEFDIPEKISGICFSTSISPIFNCSRY